MPEAQSYWQRFRNLVVPPAVNDEDLQRTWQEARERLPVPVFWLLGKAQSGKSSIVRALTGATRAEIGNGFQRCTLTAEQYAFPSEDECLLRFLDTRGLGEVDYDPAQDLHQFAEQSHLVVVVMKAMDHAQEPVLAAVEKIHALRPNWPVLLVQTCLHEGYRHPADPHLLPYPYEQPEWESLVSDGLRRSLLAQRKSFTQHGLMLRSVVVDLTQPEDGYEPVDYGVDALWTAIEELFPWGLRGIIGQAAELQETLRDLHFRAAWPHVMSHAVAAGAAGGVPVPFVDIPLVIGIQAKMAHSIAQIYDQDLNAQRLSEILGGLGLGYLGRFGTRELMKFIPGLGSAVNALYSAATTYALGVTLCHYFGQLKRGALAGTDEFKAIYAEQFEVGKEKLRAYFDGLRARRNQPPPLLEAPPEPESPPAV